MHTQEYFEAHRDPFDSIIGAFLFVEIPLRNQQHIPLFSELKEICRTIRFTSLVNIIFLLSNILDWFTSHFAGSRSKFMLVTLQFTVGQSSILTHSHSFVKVWNLEMNPEIKRDIADIARWQRDESGGRGGRRS